MISLVLLAIANLSIMFWAAWAGNWMSFAGSAFLAVVAARQAIRKMRQS